MCACKVLGCQVSLPPGSHLCPSPSLSLNCPHLSSCLACTYAFTCVSRCLSSHGPAHEQHSSSCDTGTDNTHHHRCVTAHPGQTAKSGQCEWAAGRSARQQRLFRCRCVFISALCILCIYICIKIISIMGSVYPLLFNAVAGRCAGRA